MELYSSTPCRCPFPVLSGASKTESYFLTSPKWLAQGRLNELRHADLRFRLEETEAFLARVLGHEAAHESAVALEERTEGWIAVLRLAALSLGSTADRAAFLERLGHYPDRAVSSYHPSFAYSQYEFA